MKIDINSDLGEGAANDAAVMKFISSANIACGYHAGDDESMIRTIELAIQHKIAIGAHPGYDDKANFGRLNMDISPKVIKEIVKIQIQNLKVKTEALGGELQHVKAHGAMYNQAVNNRDNALAIAQAVFEINPQLIFVGLANSLMIKVAKDIGLTTASEVFADRAYTRDGFLVPRAIKGAVITDAEVCKKRVLKMIQQSVVESIDGIEIPIQADTVCIHGDNPQALDLAKSLNVYLRNNHIQITSMKDLIK